MEKFVDKESSLAYEFRMVWTLTNVTYLLRFVSAMGCIRGNFTADISNWHHKVVIIKCVIGSSLKLFICIYIENKIDIGIWIYFYFSLFLLSQFQFDILNMILHFCRKFYVKWNIFPLLKNIYQWILSKYLQDWKCHLYSFTKRFFDKFW